MLTAAVILIAFIITFIIGIALMFLGSSRAREPQAPGAKAQRKRDTPRETLAEQEILKDELESHRFVADDVNSKLEALAKENGLLRQKFEQFFKDQSASGKKADLQPDLKEKFKKIDLFEKTLEEIKDRIASGTHTEDQMHLDMQTLLAEQKNLKDELDRHRFVADDVNSKLETLTRENGLLRQRFEQFFQGQSVSGKKADLQPELREKYNKIDYMFAVLEKALNDIKGRIAKITKDQDRQREEEAVAAIEENLKKIRDGLARQDVKAQDIKAAIDKFKEIARPFEGGA